MKRINERVIIATDLEMVEAGLFKCNPCEKEILLWTYECAPISKRNEWHPIMEVFAEPTEECTHRIDEFYGNPAEPSIDFRHFLEARGLELQELKKQEPCH